MACCESQNDLERFRARYARPRSDAVRQMERTVFGMETGSSGYTTPAQARRLPAELLLSPGTRLLDLGAGRGWPGWLLAADSGSNLISFDIPLDGLRVARARIAEQGMPARVVAGDATGLPFPLGHFEAISHSDVLCCIPDKLPALRECHRVLRPGGRLGGYLIHTPPGLNEAERIRAAELGPASVNAPLPPVDLLGSVGFEVVRHEDVTTEFHRLVRAIIRARRDLADALRKEEGDDVYEEEYDGKLTMLEGIETGLLVRSGLVAVKRDR